MTRRWWIVLLLLLAPLAQAASVHAFLDRSHVSLGDTVTLNIQSSGPLGTPDLTPLEQDFQVLGTSNSSSVQIVNGKTTRTTQLGIALKPLHAGTLTIPALDVGGTKTQPLTLQVGAAPSGGSGRAGDPVFMEANVRSSSPWVGQQTIYTVRLFYLPTVNGVLGDPSADAARLIPLDRDHRYVTERDGYTYKVIERSWALIPQRAGAITVHGPVFEGNRMGPGFPDAWFNDPNALLNNPNALLNSPLHGLGGSVRATAPVTRLEARAEPPGAGRPWLPARDVQLQLTGLPADGKVDAAMPLTVTLSVSAGGEPADALPEPELPVIAGARVYPDRTQDKTDNAGQWLRGTRRRSFAIVPDRNGTLTIPAITLDWWDVTLDRAQQASVPAHTLDVTGAASPVSSAPQANVPGATPSASAAPVVQATHAAAQTAASAPWRTIALASIALWLLAITGGLVWWTLERARRNGTLVKDVITEPRVDAKVLRQRALDAARAGDAATYERALLAWARSTHPGIATIGALREALSDAAQRDALDALERARWQGGDATPACDAVAQAFARGFAWRAAEDRSRRSAPPDLPPLYPS